MPSAANYLASASYWTDRVREEGKTPEGFDWLLGGNDAGLKSFIQETVEAIRDRKASSAGSSPLRSYDPRILHLGPGSSLLSIWMRGLVNDPNYVTHFDFAESAADLGRRWEHERWPDASEKRMHWLTGDLLDLADVGDLPVQVQRAEASSTASEPASEPAEEHGSGVLLFDIMVDKGTLDAVSCAEDLVPSPALVRRLSALAPDLPQKLLKTPVNSSLTVALNLATITRPGAAWVMLSYSGTRFDAFTAKIRDETPRSLEELASRLWRLEARRELHETQTQTQSQDGEAKADVYHWLYFLRRTDVPF